MLWTNVLSLHIHTSDTEKSSSVKQVLNLFCLPGGFYLTSCSGGTQSGFWICDPDSGLGKDVKTAHRSDDIWSNSDWENL